MQYAVHQHVATLIFSHPERANALDLDDWQQLREVVQRADADDAVRVVLLSGAGKHFCAGIDLSVLTGLQQQLAGDLAARHDQLVAFITDLQDCITAIERCRKPVIAAIHGACIGGAIDLITACDLRYCTKDASFSVKEIDLGIVADLGTLQRLPRLVGPGIATELALTARRFDGKEAARIGLVNEVLNNRDQLNFRVGQVADTIAAKPPRIVTGIKEVLQHAQQHTVAEGLEYVARYSAGVMLGGGG